MSVKKNVLTEFANHIYSIKPCTKFLWKLNLTTKLHFLSFYSRVS